MSAVVSARLSDQQIRKFRREGAVVLRGLFGEWVEPLRQGVDRNIADPGPYTRGYTPEGSPAESSATTATGGVFRNTGHSSTIHPPARSPLR